MHITDIYTTDLSCFSPITSTS